MQKFCHECAFYESIMCEHCLGPGNDDDDEPEYNDSDFDDKDLDDCDPSDWWYPFDDVPD